MKTAQPLARKAHALLVAQLAKDVQDGCRVAARVHAVDHSAFAEDIATIVGEAGHKLCHIMLPKVESVDDIVRAQHALSVPVVHIFRCMR